MKVLYVIPGLGAGGGAERSLLEMVPHLASAGIELTIAYFVVRPSDNAQAYAQFDVRLVRIPARSTLGRARALRRLAREVRPEVIHTTLFEADQAGRLAGLGTSTRVITSLTSCNYDVPRRADPASRWWRVELVRLLDGCTARHLSAGAHAVSEASRQAAARSFGLPIDRIRVVHRGRNLGAYRPAPGADQAALRTSLGVADGDQMVLAVGRHEFQKDHRTLVAAMADLRVTHPRAVLVIVGRDGGSTPGLRAAMAAYGVADRVLLLGHRDDIPALLASADVVATASVLEGCSGALIEALAAGRPLVASAIAPNRELLPGVEVALVAPGDAAGFARAIAAALDDPMGSAARTRAALDHVRSRISVEQATAAMVDLYRSLAERGSHVVAGPQDRPRPQRLFVVDDIGADGPPTAAVAREAVALAEAGREVAIATFGVGDGRRSMELEERGIVVHHLGGRSALARGVAVRRLLHGLAPAAVDVRCSSRLVRVGAR